MKVNYVLHWGKPCQMELSDALTPEVYSEGGSLERTQAVAENCAKRLGALAALLVEKKILTIAEASEACGVLGEITPL